MLVQRLRRWPNIKTALVERPVGLADLLWAATVWAGCLWVRTSTGRPGSGSAWSWCWGSRGWLPCPPGWDRPPPCCWPSGSHTCDTGWPSRISGPLCSKASPVMFKQQAAAMSFPVSLIIIPPHTENRLLGHTLFILFCAKTTPPWQPREVLSNYVLCIYVLLMF